KSCVPTICQLASGSIVATSTELDCTAPRMYEIRTCPVLGLRHKRSACPSPLKSPRGRLGVAEGNTKSVTLGAGTLALKLEPVALSGARWLMALPAPSCQTSTVPAGVKPAVFTVTLA